jgi:phosphatidylserine/phosphatidylglycerophosphate/cardiolipin synthase-like enzyme
VTTRADAQKWFLQWSSTTYGLTTTDGRPFGDNTNIAKREAASGDPWDENCTVTPMIGGYETLCAIADTLEDAIAAAKQLNDPGNVGHVYITDWRLNPLRDFSRANSWVTHKWASGDTAALDQTAVGLILKLMQAGVNVRVLVWYPVTAMRMKGMATHIDEHYYLAQIVANEGKRLNAPFRGVVGLDSRVADPLTATHHQKMCVVRVAGIDVAFVGGVDWAFTRRDAPTNPTDPAHYVYDPNALDDVTKPPPQFLDGDWQSGTDMPVPFNPAAPGRWPNETGVHYEAAANASRPGQSGSDLENTTVYGTSKQIWHDQHFMLTGPIVQTVEEQFRERWSDAGKWNELGGAGESHVFGDQVIFSQKGGAYADNGILPLDPADPASDTGSSFVQMWRTIPLRKKRPATATLSRGEFTIMAGLANATTKATQLIWLFDQYFFSRPLARLLNQRLTDAPNLHVIVVLPPFADSNPLDLIHLRKLALNDLVKGRTKSSPGHYDRVAVYNVWHKAKNLGIYVHAKAKMFDDQLLVCGSGNLNRRSFTCDTELDCAVLDAAVLDLHQHRLWNCLFPGATWPLGTRTGNWGKTFFDAFAIAAAATSSFLIADPWDTEVTTVSHVTETIETARGTSRTRNVTQVQITPPTVPTKPTATAREQSYADDFRSQPGEIVRISGQKEGETPIVDMNALIEPTSLDLQVESVTSGKAGDPGPAGRLDEMVYLIEAVAGKNSSFPHRRLP